MAKEVKLDYSKMIFDISNIPMEVDLCERFKRLAVYDEIHGYGGTFEYGEEIFSLPERDNALRYIFYYYDLNCPFQEFKSVTERAEKCLLKAGFTKEGKEWSKEIQFMVKGQIAEVNAMIKCFLFKIQNCRKFSLKCAMEKALEDTIENISSPILETDASKKEAAFKTRHANTDSAMVLVNNIEKLEIEIFQDREDIKEIISEDKDKSIFASGAAERFADMAKKSKAK